MGFNEQINGKINGNQTITGTCGCCRFNDGLIYTSYPPQVRCSFTFDFHRMGDECNCKDKVDEWIKHFE